MSHGADETARLKANIQDQLNRLLQQLQDLEELRDDIDDDEYDETRKDTMEQLTEFQEKLERMMAGDMTLVSELGQVKLALTAAIKDAFKTPEVIAMFAKREPAALRTRLAHLQEEHKLGRLPAGRFKSQAIEIIVALRKLGEKLTAEEQHFLDSASDEVKRQFETAGKAIGEAAVMSMASGGAGAGAGAAKAGGR